MFTVSAPSCLISLPGARHFWASTRWPLSSKRRKNQRRNCALSFPDSIAIWKPSARNVWNANPMRVIAQLGIWPRTSNAGSKADRSRHRRVLPSTHVWRWSRRNPALVGTAAVCLLLGAASVWHLRQPGWTRQIPPREGTFAVARTSSGAGETAPGADSISGGPPGSCQAHWVGSGAGIESPEGVEERLYSILATGVGLDAKILTDKLPKFSQAVKRDPDASSYERACASYLGKDYAEAERLFLTTVDEAQKASPTKSVDIIRALKLAGWSARKSYEFVRAREHLAEAEKLTDRQRNPREWADVQYAIANVLHAGALPSHDAEKVVRGVIEVRTQIFGPENRETLNARRLLAQALYARFRYLEGEAEFREVINLDEKMLGPENPETLRSRRDLQIAWSMGKNCRRADRVPANIETSRKSAWAGRSRDAREPCWRRQ